MRICLADDLPVNVAVIPARGGSKRIPRKNIKDFCGKPIIAYSIQAAQASNLFDHIVVSTDDDEIAAVAEKFGAEIPFERPPELADDQTTSRAVIAHAVSWFQHNWGPIDYVCSIYATAPLLQPDYLKAGLELLKQHPDADFTFSVTSYAFPIFRSLKQNPDGTVSMNWPEYELSRSQDLPETWHDAGQFYWGRPAAFLDGRAMFSSRSYPVILPRTVVQDIDTLEDWNQAEKMFQAHSR